VTVGRTERHAGGRHGRRKVAAADAWVASPIVARRFADRLNRYGDWHGDYQAGDGENATTFSVSVSGATANSSLEVAVDGTVIGQLYDDSTGAGSLSLSSSPTSTQQHCPRLFRPASARARP